MKSEKEYLKERVRRLENRLFALGEMHNHPCFVCGYNGEGYYQPEKHKCAEKHHALFNKDLHTGMSNFPSQIKL